MLWRRPGVGNQCSEEGLSWTCRGLICLAKTIQEDLYCSFSLRIKMWSCCSSSTTFYPISESDTNFQLSQNKLFVSLCQTYLSMPQPCQTVLSQWAVLLKQALRSFTDSESHPRLKRMDFHLSSLSSSLLFSLLSSSPSFFPVPVKTEFTAARHFWKLCWHAPDWQLICRSWQFIQHARRDWWCG